VQQVATTNLQLISHHSKCPPGGFDAVDHSVKVGMDLPLGSGGKSFQVKWSATFSSEMFSGHGWLFW